jgi:hypothetical protein
VTTAKDPAQYYPGLADACRRAYHATIDAIRDAARECGYAIGVHGSLARDIDLIAAPWTEDAVSPADLAEIVRATVAKVGGMGFVSRNDPAEKPHGRLCWSIHLRDGPYLDLSVMPRLPA